MKRYKYPSLLLMLFLIAALTGCAEPMPAKENLSDSVNKYLTTVPGSSGSSKLSITNLAKKLVLSGQNESVLKDQLSTHVSVEDLNLYGMTLTDVTPITKCVHLKHLDVRHTGITEEQFLTLQSALPECEILWSVPLEGKYYDSTSEKLILPNLETPDFLYYFPNLKTVEMMDEVKTMDEIRLFTEAFPDVTFYFSFTLEELGFKTIALNGKSESLDLSRKTIKDKELLLEYLDLLPELKELTMCRCGLTNEEMAEIRDAYPNTKVIWEVLLGYRYWIRTDATSFSTLVNEEEKKGHITSADCEVFQYFTDLVALDLGHQKVSDLSFLYYLPNLHVLILADNDISDITPIGSLTELRYLEIFMNYYISDLEPLRNLEHLHDLNLSYVWYVEDFSPLYEMESLERCWMIGCQLSRDVRNTINENLPEGCTYQDLETLDGATGSGWRDSPKQYAIIYMFRHNTIDPIFLE